MTVADHALSAIEKTLLKNQLPIGTKRFCPEVFLPLLESTAAWSQEGIFTKDPDRRRITAMSTNQSYLRTNITSPFHYQKFNLKEIVIYWIGLPVAGTPLPRTAHQRIYFNTLDAIDFLDKKLLCYSLAGYSNLFILAFKLTST